MRLTGASASAIWAGGTAYLEVKNCEVHGNTTGSAINFAPGGGGLYSEALRTIISDSVFYDNAAISYQFVTQPLHYDPDTGNGGAIYTTDYNGTGSQHASSTLIERSSIYHSSSDASGGGVFMANSHAKIRNSTIAHNVSNKGGKPFAIAFYALQSGGGVINTNGWLKVFFSTITDNYVDQPYSPVGDGIYSYSGFNNADGIYLYASIVAGNHHPTVSTRPTYDLGVESYTSEYDYRYLGSGHNYIGNWAPHPTFNIGNNIYVFTDPLHLFQPDWGSTQQFSGIATGAQMVTSGGAGALDLVEKAPGTHSYGMHHYYEPIFNPPMQSVVIDVATCGFPSQASPNNGPFPSSAFMFSPYDTWDKDQRGNFRGLPSTCEAGAIEVNGPLHTQDNQGSSDNVELPENVATPHRAKINFALVHHPVQTGQPIQIKFTNLAPQTEVNVDISDRTGRTIIRTAVALDDQKSAQLQGLPLARGYYTLRLWTETAQASKALVVH